MIEGISQSSRYINPNPRSQLDTETVSLARDNPPVYSLRKALDAAGANAVSLYAHMSSDDAVSSNKNMQCREPVSLVACSAQAHREHKWYGARKP